MARRSAATVLCVRRAADGVHQEVLVGQSHVRNWYRSTAPSDVVLMRYGGEFKLPGGVQDEQDPTLRHTALRELREEFLLPADESQAGGVHDGNFIVHLLATHAIAAHGMNASGAGFVMHCFVALEDENPWVKSIDAAAVTATLRQREDEFQALLASGEYWKVAPGPARSAAAPEVHECRWMHVPALLALLSAPRTTPANDFQKAEFKRYSIRERDPMWSVSN